MNFVLMILSLLFPFIFLGLVIGLIKPSWVIRWGKNKNRKQVLKYYGIGMVLVFFMIGFLAPAPSVTDKVEDARNYIKENNYKQAIASYEGSLSEWNKEKDYPFNKEDIKSEFKNAKKEYSKKLIKNIKTNISNNNFSKAEQKLNEINKYWPENEKIKELQTKINKGYSSKLVNKAKEEFSNGNISKAEDKLNEAKKYWSKSSEFLLLQAKIKKKKTEKEINNLLDEALKEAESDNYEKAVQKIADANKLGDIPRINKVKNKLSTQIDSIIDKHISKSNTALEEWELEKAKKHITILTNLDSNNEQIKSLKNNLEEKENVIDEIGEKPINSSWDGSVRIVKNYLEDRLKDPDSVEYIEWSPVHLTYVNNEPFWRVRVKYRAKNSFGGYVIEEKLAYMMHNQVVAMENF